MENIDKSIMLSRLAEYLSEYAWRYNIKSDLTQEYRGLYTGYLQALTDTGVIPIQKYGDLHLLYLDVQTSEPGKNKNTTECAELIKRVLGD